MMRMIRMYGEHNISIRSSTGFNYNITLCHRISILTGDSGTGKTLLEELVRLRGTEGIHVVADVPCYDERDFANVRDLSVPEGIFICDEDFFRNGRKGFKSVLRYDKYYFLLIVRSSLPRVSYNWRAVYKLTEVNGVRSIDRLYKLGCPNLASTNIIVEDSKSVLFFLRDVIGYKNVSSCYGKSNAVNHLDLTSKTLVVLDGCDAGSVIHDLEPLMNLNPNISLFMPECFEELILSSPMFESDEIVQDFLKSPEKYYITEDKTIEHTYLRILQSAMCRCKYVKKELTDCITKDCCYNSHIIDCLRYYSGDKQQMWREHFLNKVNTSWRM